MMLDGYNNISQKRELFHKHVWSPDKIVAFKLFCLQLLIAMLHSFGTFPCELM